MAKILLDYFLPVTAISPTAQASTAFLKQVAIVVKPKGGVTAGSTTLVTNMSQVAALTNNTEAQQLFNAGLTRLYVIVVDDLYLETILAAQGSKFFTLLVSSDFSKDDIIATPSTGTITISSFANLVSGTADSITIESTVFTAQAGAAVLGDATFQAVTSNNLTAASLAAQINAHAVAKTFVTATVVGAVVTLTSVLDGSGGNTVDVAYTNNDANVGATLSGITSGHLTGGDGLYAGVFKGVIGVSSTDDAFLAAQAIIENRVAFHTTNTTLAKNMFFAFGKLLSNSLSWKNQQYITVPFADDVDELGEANNLFDSRISFALSDDEYGQKLGLFAAGGKAIVAPYIIRNLEIDLQSTGLSYVSANQPDYSVTSATLLEDEEQKVIDSYIQRGLIREGEVDIRLENSNFVASAYIDVDEPTALWRVFAQITQTLAGS